jgi:hypothetical protein
MNQLTIRAGVRMTIARQRIAQATKDAVRDERGEIGSWLVLAAGLAVLAGATVAVLGPWVTNHVNAITGTDGTGPATPN